MGLMISEFVPTMAGEGSLTGMPIVQLTLSGCNLWSGAHEDRLLAKSDCAKWCDVDFLEGRSADTETLCHNILAVTQSWETPAVRFTGGEPLLQFMTPNSEKILKMLKAAGVFLAVETNGTLLCRAIELFDHVTVSPKRLKRKPESLSHIKLRRGSDLKVVMPQWETKHLREMDDWDFDNRYVQPLDPGDAGGMYESTVRCIAIAQDLGWKVSPQVQKILGFP